MNQIWLAFLTGLTTGGISCFAVQGGLLATSLSHQKEDKRKAAVVYFSVGKLIGYTLLGALLGLVGSSLVLSPKVQGAMQIAAGILMLLAVARLLDVHPFFRKLTFTPPKKLFRIVRSKSIDEGLTSSGILGFLTILVPCGVTQSMMLLSISTGNALTAAFIMFAFVLGTTPVFFGLGIASSEVFRHKSLRYVASLIIFILAIISINTGQILRGSVHTLQNYYLAATQKDLPGSGNSKGAGIDQAGNQNVTIEVFNAGYEADVKTLKAGVPVKITLISNNVQSCSRAFTIPQYNITKMLPVNGKTTLEFTPTKKGRLTYTCSMGMYTGFFEVI